MKCLSLLAVALLGCAFPAQAAPTVEWQSQFGGLDQEEVSSAVPIAGGGYLVAGTHIVQPGGPINGGSQTFMLARTDAAGAPLWQREYQLNDSYTNGGRNAVEAGDGGFVMVGTAHYTPRIIRSEIALIKTDGDGDLLWTRFFSENRAGSSDNTYGVHVQRTADGGFIVLGDYRRFSGTDSNILLIRTDADGNELWRTRPGGDSPSMGSEVRETADGGFAVCGSTWRDENLYDSWDLYLLKTDATGAAVWSATHGTTVFDNCYSCRQTADGGYVLFGDTMHSDVDNSADYLLVKTDGAGNLSWTKTWGSSGDDWSGGVAEVAGGGFVVSGARRSENITSELQEQLEIVQFSASGNKLSGILLGEPAWTGRPYAEGASIETTPDGGFIVGGLTAALRDESTPVGGHDVYLVKLGPLAGGAAVDVAIDIKPGNAANQINTKSEGTTPVAILGAPDFDASQVDPVSVRLADAPVATNKNGRPNVSVHDVNGDGIDDMLLHVLTAQMQVADGDTAATLVGQTVQGDLFEGSDGITVLK